MGGNENVASSSFAGGWCRWLLPETIRDDPARLRGARVSLLVPPIFSLFGLVMAVLHWWAGNDAQVLLIGVAVALGVFSMTWVRLTGSVAIAINAQLALLQGALVFLAWRAGGVTAPTLTLLFVVPMIAGLVLGRRWAFLWTGLAVLSISGFFVMHRLGAFPPSMWRIEQMPRVNTFAGGIALLVALIVTVVYESDRSHALREAERAREQARAASQAKGMFLANMSHEIRTPLFGLTGALQLLSKTSLDAEQQRLIEMMMTSGQSLRGVVDDVLDLSKLDAGHVTLSPVDIDLAELIDQVVSSVTVTAAAKRLEVHVVMDPDLPLRVTADPQRLRQVLQNLLGNAVKFTERGSVCLRARRGDERLLLSVEDTGPGIPDDVVPRLFDPFVQGDASPAKAAGGTGLGLAISRQLVEMMGGRLEVETEVGVGSSFSFAISLVAPREGPVLPPSSDLADFDVVVVTEQAAVREVGAAVAARLGARSQASLTEPRAGRTRVALVDVRSDADEPAVVARWAEKVDAVVALSALGVDTVALGANGAKCCVAKPLRLRPLANALRSLVHEESTVVDRWDGDRRSVVDSVGNHILLAEDNQINQRIAKGYLESLGHSVVIVGDGAQAVARLFDGSSPAFDLVLMDAHMPGLPGADATRRIRARELREGRPRTPIVALTADAMPGARQRLLEAGMDDYLAKPFDIHELRRVIARWGRDAGPRPLSTERGRGDPTESECPASAPAFAPDAVQRLQAMGDGTLEELMAMFIDTTEQRLASIREAGRRGDAETLRAEAHALKSGARQLGAMRLGDRLEEIELRPEQYVTLAPKLDAESAHSLREAGAFAHSVAPPERACHE
ncbi:MAG: ATP-binding protein [Myxococcota bacterium]